MIQEGKVVAALNIHLDVSESGNLLHKQCFVDSQFGTTVWFQSTTIVWKLSIEACCKYLKIASFSLFKQQEPKIVLKSRFVIVVAKKSWWNGDLNAKKFRVASLCSWLRKESCDDALGVEISRRNRLAQNAKKIPTLIMYARQKKILHTHSLRH